MVNSAIYQGYSVLDFEATQEGDLLFYKTAFPIYHQGKQISSYNFFFRTPPSDLKQMPLDGEISLMELTVINGSNEEMACEGKGAIAIANFIHVHNFLETEVYRDEEAGCDEQKRYAYVNFVASDKNEIEQYGPACFNIYFKDCEIIKSSEKYMAEVLSKTKTFLEQ